MNAASSRVTYAAVFIPDDPSQDHEFLLPEKARLAPGYAHYDHERHHKSKNNGTLCCGNCYLDGKHVEIHHRKATNARIAGGDMNGHRATFAANANTTAAHSDYCNERRERLRSEYETLKSGITFNINMSETYSESHAPHRLHSLKRDFKVDLRDERLEGRKSVPVNNEIAEIIKAARNMSRSIVQSAVYAVDGHAYTHEEFFIDGDDWRKVLFARNKDGRVFTGAFHGEMRLFHIFNPKTKNLRDLFNDAGKADDRIKIPLRQYEFAGRDGRLHIIQPSIVTSRKEIKAMFEREGEFLVLGKFHHVPVRPKGKNGAMVHQVFISLESENMAVELYNFDRRKLRDYDAMQSLEKPFAAVSEIFPKARISSPRAKPALTGQMELFTGAAPG